MKSTVQKSLALILSLLLVVSVFTGCGSQESSSTGTVTSSSASSSAETDSSTAGTDPAAVKTVTVKVVHGDGSEKEFAIQTESENLRGALEQEKLVEGEESEYGLYVKTVDGETVDDAKQEWWCITKDGEMTPEGVDGTKIADGETYEFTFTVGYDQ